MALFLAVLTPTVAAQEGGQENRSSEGSAHSSSDSAGGHGAGDDGRATAASASDGSSTSGTSNEGQDERGSAGNRSGANDGTRGEPDDDADDTGFSASGNHQDDNGTDDTDAGDGSPDGAAQNGDGGNPQGQGSANQGQGSDKVTICHATASETNPYNRITVSVNSVVKGEGHAAHHDPGDIIPPLEEHDYDGRNWDAEGRAIYDNGCEAVDGGSDTQAGTEPDAEPEPATVTVTKVVPDDVPEAELDFGFRLECNDTIVRFSLGDDESTTWAAGSDEPRAAGDECDLIEVEDHGATTVTVVFNGSEVAEGGIVSLEAGDNTFVVTNGFAEDGEPAADTSPSPDSGAAGEQVTTGAAIDVTKVADTTSADVGETITYTYVITNVGTVELSNLQLSDDKLGVLTDRIDDRTLAVDESVTVTATHDVTSTDVGPITNVATAAGFGPDGERVTDTATATVDIAEVLGVVIEAPEGPALPGPVTPVEGQPTEGGTDAAPAVEVAAQGAAGEGDAAQVAAVGQQVEAAELPRTGGSNSALLLLALTLLGSGVLTLRQGHTRVRAD